MSSNLTCYFNTSQNSNLYPPERSTRFVGIVLLQDPQGFAYSESLFTIIKTILPRKIAETIRI